jgi:hypothetical protein
MKAATLVTVLLVVAGVIWLSGLPHIPAWLLVIVVAAAVKTAFAQKRMERQMMRRWWARLRD